MSPERNTQRLLDLMSENRLSIADVARLTGRSVQTVKIWRCSNAQTIPSHTLDLLETRAMGAKALAFLEAKLEYLTSTVTPVAVRERALAFLAVCHAYLETGLINAETHAQLAGYVSDYLAELGINSPENSEVA